MTTLAVAPLPDGVWERGRFLNDSLDVIQTVPGDLEKTLVANPEVLRP
ncbi:hypothetical protein [Thermomonospora umbrina]|uniref:Uncharacterized protein n=1 Tax=Thermomonospora umbrina TaxID=111806 RepID=A0A3D9SWT1_9ACTN|nr:hypothetical protein [Thermomonospora umbrina]REF00289.1 hypothetical protein DFJ69_5819 [Thermomonospora umbrina]